MAQPVGLVCLAPASATACPAPPVTVTGSVGSQLQVPLLIQGSDLFSGFDITLKTNHTILSPAGVSVAGSLLYGGSIIVECVGNVSKAGPGCASTDTLDTLHLVFVGPLTSSGPVNGLLFTAIFNITGTMNTAISYQTGCSQSSVAGTTTCVQFSNGSLSIPQETAQAATYTLAPAPTFTLQTTRTEITLRKGATTNSTLTLSSLNGFTGKVALSITFNSTAQHPPTFSASPSSVTLTSGGVSTALFVVSTRSNTSRIPYSVTITATGGGVSESITIPVSVLS